MEAKTINITLELNDVNKNSIIQTLVGIVSDSEQKMSKLSKAVAQLKDEKTSLEVSCKRLVELDNSVQTLNGKIEVLEKLNKRQESIIDKCNQENGKLLQEKEAVVKDRENLFGQIKSLSEQLEGLKKTKDDYMNQLQTLISDKTALQKDLASRDETINEIRGEKSSLVNDLRVSNEAKDSQSMEIVSLKESINVYISEQKEVIFDVVHEIYKLLQEGCEKSSNDALRNFIMEICKKDSQKNPGLKQILQSNDDNPWENIITKADSSLAKLASLVWWSEQESIYPIIKEEVNNIEKISALFKSVLIPNLNRFYQLGLELIEGKFDVKIEGYTRDEYGHSNFSKIFPDIILDKGLWCEIALIRRTNSPGACYYY